MNQREEKNRNQWLDTLRGIAACWVVMFHLNQVIPQEDNLYFHFVGLGYLGVPIFFIVSGYCIYFTVKRSTSILHFYLRRWCRIYPPYLFSILLVITVCAFRKLVTGTNDVAYIPNNFHSWLATLTLTTSPVSSVPTINWVYWSLSYELFFYLIMGFIILKPKYHYLLLYSLTILSLVPRISEQHNFLFFFNQWGLFSLGIALKGISRSEDIKAVLLLLISLISIIVNNQIEVQVVAIFTAITIWFSDYNKEILQKQNFINKIGKISYSLYLLHVPIGCYLLLQYRQGIWIKYLPMHIIYDFTVLILCLALSVLFFKYVELPSFLIVKHK
ncbi:MULTISPECIES: acyltransferase family protein [unclassified Tolypothrix]|uniref:acyltransferase family protein n=1 Tax=unclassified Tolypothrix TaxID=2649714 RepID=UPI0005EAB24D|nr:MULTISPECIES: acyltransferase [unclassified Tolypothrix]BAY92032.1 putative acyltransferase [Microchaete diplosiphon NIES-3275]EKF04772.1 putative acyltransferase [Tolypothrix sp. PCC 7601]MBE9081763.1 acyltransferase [Tolypothrix sp. LEGE 11397]UYD26020.1 acyltransferase [Tolypothrix sp. PCC 7712]UYD31741.1 acyltransferase [Tolypothrix sp. PCC 7601]